MNRPRLTVRDRSPIHFGGLALTVEGDPVTSLTGHYWTDRATCGELRTSARWKAAAHTFAEAQAAFEEPEDPVEGTDGVPEPVRPYTGSRR